MLKVEFVKKVNDYKVSFVVKKYLKVGPVIKHAMVNLIQISFFEVSNYHKKLFYFLTTKTSRLVYLLPLDKAYFFINHSYSKLI